MRNFLIALPFTIMAGGALAQDNATVTDNCANHLNTSPSPTVGALLNCLAEMQRKIDQLEADASMPSALSSADIAAIVAELKTNHADDIKGEKGDAGEPGQVGANGSPGRDGNDALIPAGAVMAFDLPEGCPDSWTRFEAGSGRMIVGVGTRVGVEGSFRLLADSNGSVYQTGGAETHKLTEREMPSHSHVFAINHRKGSGSGTTTVGRIPADETSANASRRTTATGGNIAHNNMPPYIALYYCKKG